MVIMRHKPFPVRDEEQQRALEQHLRHARPTGGKADCNFCWMTYWREYIRNDRSPQMPYHLHDGKQVEAGMTVLDEQKRPRCVTSKQCLYEKIKEGWKYHGTWVVTFEDGGKEEYSIAEYVHALPFSKDQLLDAYTTRGQEVAQFHRRKIQACYCEGDRPAATQEQERLFQQELDRATENWKKAYYQAYLTTMRTGLFQE
jgi:hypothetical protein